MGNVGNLVIYSQILVGLPLFDKRGVVRMVFLSNQKESQKFEEGSVAQFNLGYLEREK